MYRTGISSNYISPLESIKLFTDLLQPSSIKFFNLAQISPDGVVNEHFITKLSTGIFFYLATFCFNALKNIYGR